MQLVGCLYGIASDRQLCREVHLNLAYRWFCRLPLHEDVPDHSSLTRIRDRLGEQKYREIFERLLKLWHDQGRLSTKRVVTDATLIAANAAMDSLVEREDGDPKSRVLKQYDQRYDDFQHGKRQRRVANQTHVSRSDPDATMVYRRGVSGGLKYKVHYCADADSRMIVDCFTTTGAAQEGPIFPQRIDHLCDDLGYQVEEAIADRGYGRGPTYAAFRKRRIRTYIPLHDARLGKGKMTPTTFLYQSRQDRYQCPEGHYLYPYEKQDNGIKRYRILGGHCRECPQREACLPESAKQRARFVFRSVHQHEIDLVRRRQRTPTFGARMVERKWKIEGLFAEAKSYHSMRRAKYRGLQKVSIQALITAITQNLKRIVNHHTLRQLLLLIEVSRYTAKRMWGRIEWRHNTYLPPAPTA